jgi:predicted transcriptional regulator
MIKSTFYLASDRMAALDALAKQEARPKAEILRDALDEYLERHARPLPAWIGMIDDDDDSLTSTNVDEWLAAHWHPE